MTALSPVTRRILAIGLLVLALLLILQRILVPVTTLIGAKRDELSQLRGRAAHLIGVDRQVMPAFSSLPVHSTIKADAIGTAQLRLKLAITQAATAAGVEVRGLMARDNPADAPQLLQVEINVTGSEEGLLRFVGALEHGDPLVRFARWTVQAPATPGQPITLSAKLAAAWEHEG